MINSNDIQERQNSEFALKVQYAARMCFNSAEKYNHLTWIACLVSAFSVFFPSGMSANPTIHGNLVIHTFVCPQIKRYQRF